ncbi:porin family protein [Legionella sp. PC1000]|uniref:outer membrane protein n=1 Tax=Legionella sp. PC1000 TaxID=2746060 RepID=UPI0018601D0A|nr:outer membrane beta-barrel protein [Legionella sp. PC1000]QLZ67537.1 porin family protein [Legionella sp. PC1000]
MPTRKLSAGLLLLVPTLLSAGTMGQITISPAYSWVITLSGGPAWADNPGKSQTLSLQPDVFKNYAVDNASETLGLGGLFIGFQKNINPSWLGQLGFAIEAVSKITVRGDIWEDADPDFNNYWYQYDIRPIRIALKGKILTDIRFWALPYLSGSLGVSFNRASDYSIIPKIPEEIPAPFFSSKTETSLSYSIGAGLQKQFHSNWSAGVGYEFADWGRSQLGRAPGQTLGNGLSDSHLYTHTLQFNVTFIA